MLQKIWNAKIAADQYTMRILHWLPVQTGICSSRVTVYGGNEALPSFRYTATRELDNPVCTDNRCLILFLAYFISIIIRTEITKTDILVTHFFLIVVYELTTSFKTVNDVILRT
jgi:hypothetical protein